MPNQWRRLDESLRQYLGVERAGRKLIHVNVLGGEAFSLARRPFKRSAIERAWRSTAFVICDGGPDFFGAEYDVAAGKFTGSISTCERYLPAGAGVGAGAPAAGLVAGGVGGVGAAAVSIFVWQP